MPPSALAPGVLLDRRVELDRRCRLAGLGGNVQVESIERRAARSNPAPSRAPPPRDARLPAEGPRRAANSSSRCAWLFAAGSQSRMNELVNAESARSARLVDPKLQARGLAELAPPRARRGSSTRPRHRCCYRRRVCVHDRMRRYARRSVAGLAAAASSAKLPDPRSRSRNASPAVRRSRRSPPTPEISPTPSSYASAVRTDGKGIARELLSARTRADLLSGIESSAMSSSRLRLRRRGPCRLPRSTRRGTRR